MCGLEELTINEMLNSHPAGELIKKLTYNDTLHLIDLMDKSVPFIRKLLSRRILTPEFNDRIFQEEFSDKTVTPAIFKAAEKPYMTRVSGKIFDEDKFLPAKGEEKIPYLEKCHKDYKKACVRGLALLPITLPITAIALTTYASVIVGCGIVWSGAWAYEKVSDANARMLGKETRSSVRHIDKIFGKKSKLFGDYKRVAFPVLQSSLAIVAAGAFAAFGTNNKEDRTPDLPTSIEQSVTPERNPLKKEAQSPAKKDSIYIIPKDKLTKVDPTSLQYTEVSKGIGHVKTATNKSNSTVLNEQINKEKIIQHKPHIAFQMSKMKNKSMG